MVQRSVRLVGESSYKYECVSADLNPRPERVHVYRSLLKQAAYSNGPVSVDDEQLIPSSSIFSSISLIKLYPPPLLLHPSLTHGFSPPPPPQTTTKRHSSEPITANRSSSGLLYCGNIMNNQHIHLTKLSSRLFRRAGLVHHTLPMASPWQHWDHRAPAGASVQGFFIFIYFLFREEFKERLRGGISTLSHTEHPSWGEQPFSGPPITPHAAREPYPSAGTDPARSDRGHSQPGRHHRSVDWSGGNLPLRADTSGRHCGGMSSCPLDGDVW